ncbi:MAG: glycosyltransferase family 39 protein [Candidatus Omnitrophica bacterium]|nr:glycosyltransferase family 39 protein [Candidatus Omnitrophota bacterium]
MKKNGWDIFLIAITPVLFFLVFWNLGDQYLWYDESQTAVLSRSVLQYGYPRASIGDFLVTTDEVYGIAGSYIAQPWLQNYVCAASFGLLGESTASARLPFALFGFLSFYLLYYLGRRLFNDPWVCRIAVVIAMTSVPYLLHIRQCRYYSLTIFLTLVVMLGYLWFMNRERWGAVMFVAGSFLLFHANFGCMIPLAGGIFLHFMTQPGMRQRIKPFLGMYALTALLLLPWAYIYKIWVQAEAQESSIARNARFFASKINDYLFPYRFLAVVLAVMAVIRRKISWPWQAIRVNPVYLLSLLVLVDWLFLLCADYTSMRYLIHIAGFLFLIEAYLVRQVVRWNKFTGILLLVILCCTDLLNTSLYACAARPFTPIGRRAAAIARDKGILSEHDEKRISKELNKADAKAHVRMYFFDYLYEITHHYDGPLEGVVTYLKAHAAPGETIKAHSFNANDLFFYTALKVDFDFSIETYPEWIFLRDYWIEDAFYRTSYFDTITKRYDKIVLDYPDIRFENRPDDMDFHHFRTAPLDKKIALYRRRS